MISIGVNGVTIFNKSWRLTLATTDRLYWHLKFLDIDIKLTNTKYKENFLKDYKISHNAYEVQLGLEYSTFILPRKFNAQKGKFTIKTCNLCKCYLDTKCLYFTTNSNNTFCIDWPSTIADKFLLDISEYIDFTLAKSTFILSCTFVEYEGNIYMQIDDLIDKYHFGPIQYKDYEYLMPCMYARDIRDTNYNWMKTNFPFPIESISIPKGSPISVNECYMQNDIIGFRNTKYKVPFDIAKFLQEYIRKSDITSNIAKIIEPIIVYHKGIHIVLGNHVLSIENYTKNMYAAKMIYLAMLQTVKDFSVANCNK